jgi:hypothetical protein
VSAFTPALKLTGVSLPGVIDDRIIGFCARGAVVGELDFDLGASGEVTLRDCRDCPIEDAGLSEIVSLPDVKRD